MFANDSSVLVLPDPNMSRNGTANTGNYPIMCSHSNFSGKKHYTLLPPLTNSQLIDNDLKYKLNRYSFGSCSATERSIPTPATSPLPDAFSLTSQNDLHDHSRQAEYTASLLPDSRNSSLASLPALDTLTSAAPIELKKVSAKRVVKKDASTQLLLQPQSQNEVEQRRRYVCKVCSKAFTTSGHLARHNRIHTGEKNHICPFEGCNQRFSRHDNCIQHYRTHFKKKSAS